MSDVHFFGVGRTRVKYLYYGTHWISVMELSPPYPSLNPQPFGTSKPFWRPPASHFTLNFCKVPLLSRVTFLTCPPWRIMAKFVGDTFYDSYYKFVLLNRLNFYLIYFTRYAANIEGVFLQQIRNFLCVICIFYLVCLTVICYFYFCKC